MKTPVLTMYKGTLPQRKLEGSTYFVTRRLAASQVSLGCQEKTLMADAVKHFSGVRYNPAAYNIMDDHLHVPAAPSEAVSLQEIVRNRQSFSADRLQRNFAGIGKIRQGEYFDRTVRDAHEPAEKTNYTKRIENDLILNDRFSITRPKI